MASSATALRGWLRPVAGAAILAGLVVHLGAEPFLDGLRQVDGRALLAAVILTAATTWCCARRWSLLAGRLDVPVSVGAAYRACYHAQFLNAVLPGGVVGDVHRAVRHGRDAGALSRGLRSVVWDRSTGQLVQALMALAAVLWLTAPVQRAALWTVLVVLSAAVVAWVVVPRRVFRALVTEIRQVPGAAGVWPRVVLLSALAAAGHVVVFVVAARTVGVAVPLTELVPLALVVLVAAAIPLNIAGWGPREGAAAWVFAAAGPGSSTGVEVTVAYGVMALVATLPGAVVLVGGRWSRGSGLGGLRTSTTVGTGVEVRGTSLETTPGAQEEHDG